MPEEYRDVQDVEHHHLPSRSQMPMGRSDKHAQEIDKIITANIPYNIMSLFYDVTEHVHIFLL